MMKKTKWKMDINKWCLICQVWIILCNFAIEFTMTFKLIITKTKNK